MDHVRGYHEDYANPLLLSMSFLKKVNVMLYDDNINWFKKNWRFFYIVPFILFHYSAMFVYIIKVFIEGKNIFEDAFMIPIFVVSVQTLIKQLAMICVKPQFEHIIDELAQVWRTDNLNDLQEDTKKLSKKELRLSEIAFIRLPQFVAWHYLLIPILETLIRNVILKENDEKYLPFSCSYPFDPTSNWFVYAATYIFQTYCMFGVVYSYLGVDFLIISISCHLSVLFLLLSEDLRQVKPSSNDNNNVRRVNDSDDIREFVKRHQKLLVIAQKLDDAVNTIMFINLIFTSINLTFFGLAALVANNMFDRVSNLITVLNVMILIFIICYFGEKLKSACEEVFTASCDNPWTEGDIRYKRILLIIMMRSQKPCYLTSLRYKPITLTTFTAVLSTTWSYFSLMITMFENSE